jgi:GTP-binding protein
VLVDRARIYVKAGNGGNGSASFRREKYVPRGGPDGGDGGRGGDVRLRVKPNLTSLMPFQFTQHFRAETGQAGAGRQQRGRRGKTLTVDVPPGTIVWDDATGEQIADLVEPGEELVVARGGRGGLGNVHFKSATRQAPRLAELGEPGEERWLRLELRLIADVGLVGLPNAGKSTLLAAASAARPKIADYPFTTLEPNLGVVEVGGKGGQTFVLADIPGLIEGAAAGSGLGHEFLRHVTRTRVLVHVLDASGGVEGRDPLVDFRTINQELTAYGGDLADKPMLVALNKIDLPEARAHLPELRRVLAEQDYPVYPIAAATGEGVPELMAAVAARLREQDAREREQAKPTERRVYTLPAVDERAWEATQLSRHHFAVTGVAIERLTKMTDFDSDDAVDRFQTVLRRSGIEAELERLGIDDGDVVHIAGHELVWGEQEDAAPRAGGRRRPP